MHKKSLRASTVPQGYKSCCHLIVARLHHKIPMAACSMKDAKIFTFSKKCKQNQKVRMSKNN